VLFPSASLPQAERVAAVRAQMPTRLRMGGSLVAARLPA
jgi:hypothetical protein